MTCFRIYQNLGENKLWKAKVRCAIEYHTEHHSSRVESASVKESADSRILSENRFVIRREGLGSADGRLDADLLEAGDSVDCALDVHAKDVPVQFVKSESELFLDLKKRKF